MTDPTIEESFRSGYTALIERNGKNRKQYTFLRSAIYGSADDVLTST